MDGMKFQPCRPGFVDGRNAILAADVALTGGANQCEIWRGVRQARPRLRAPARAARNNRTDGVEAFDLPASCTAATFGGFQSPVERAPAVNQVERRLHRAGEVHARRRRRRSIDSQPVDCTRSPRPASAVRAGPPASGAEGGEYHVNWKTDASWAGTCRTADASHPGRSDAVAYFRFN